MNLQEACTHHVQTATTHHGEIKLYAECIVTHIEHKLIQTHLDDQSMGMKCKSLTPQYRAIPTSLLTVTGLPPLTGPTPIDCSYLQPDKQIHCYRSVLCEPLENPQEAVKLSVQHVLARTPFTFKIPHSCALILETVSDQVQADDIILPKHVQKENGTTYIPLTSSRHQNYIIELFQVWRATTFAELEFKSLSIQKGLVPVYGVRVSLVSSPVSNKYQSPQHLHTEIQKVLKFIDLLVYG